jgi:hypothetical protein
VSRLIAPHRLFILAVFYAVYFMRSILAADRIEGLALFLYHHGD